MNINIIFSWPKEYLNIVMGNGYGNPHTKEYFKYRDEETVILTPGNISNIVMRRILIHNTSQLPQKRLINKRFILIA